MPYEQQEIILMVVRRT